MESVEYKDKNPKLANMLTLYGTVFLAGAAASLVLVVCVYYFTFNPWGQWVWLALPLFGVTALFSLIAQQGKIKLTQAQEFLTLPKQQNLAERWEKSNNWRFMSKFFFRNYFILSIFLIGYSVLTGLPVYVTALGRLISAPIGNAVAHQRGLLEVVSLVLALFLTVGMIKFLIRFTQALDSC